MSSTREHNLSPEILFLIKEQAKAIAKINSLQKKVEQLELSVSSSRPQSTTSTSQPQLSRDALSASSSTTTKSVNSPKERNILSDDSGGEYSRATTTVSDEDELSSLLDQIARYSQQFHINHQQNKCNSSFNSHSQPNISSNSSSNQLPQSMQTQTQLYKHALLCFEPTPTSTRMSQSRETMSVAVDTQKQYNSHQSLSALLFEPNVETVLKNIDDIIDGERKVNTSQLMAAYSSPHSSSSLYDGNAIVAATGVTAAVNASSIGASNSSTNWQLERVKSIIKQRKNEEYESQMRLADQWLKTHLQSQPISSDQQRFNNYIDSLEPFNFR